MDCQCCGKQKNQLHPKNSDIINGVTLLMCQSCIDAGMEPRWVIVLAGRSNGMASVAQYITRNKYFGHPITAQELLS
jgi:hypothetical protein